MKSSNSEFFSLILLGVVSSLALAWPSPSALISRTSRVLNFFPIPVSDDCPAKDGRRTGVCMNPYECRQQNGEADGKCALGFGVCCILKVWLKDHYRGEWTVTVSCGATIESNITYFVSPGFPSLSTESRLCKLKIKKMASDVTQIRLDFIHFNMGQPNRKTGICDSDTFKVTGGSSRDVSICGQNSGQHLYFDVENTKDPVEITLNLTQSFLPRIWEIKIMQIEFNNRAPAGCSQYFHGTKGTIQTMNYAINGRHLASQDYNICIRQEERMCSIAYEPCDENSFKIGPPIIPDDLGSGEGPVIGAQGTPTGQGSPSVAQSTCGDRVVMPCDTEDFIAPVGSPGLCDLLHCGNTFCSGKDGPCRIESSVKPFNIRVQFGASPTEENPDDNIGMCLRYEQQSCT